MDQPATVDLIVPRSKLLPPLLTTARLGLIAVDRVPILYGDVLTEGTDRPGCSAEAKVSAQSGDCDVVPERESQPKWWGI